MPKAKEPDVPTASETTTTTTTAQPELSKAEQKEVRIIERVIENREIAPADAFGKLTRSQINLIKSTVARGSSDDELRMFIQVCKGANLNPFLRQVHLVPFWDSKEGVERRAIIVGIDGFRAVAESSGVYAGNDDPIYGGEDTIDIEVWEDKKKVPKKLTVPTKATVTVFKVVAGSRYAFTATARWDEYYPGPKKGNQWHKMPYMMLGKCAEALALRKAFPKLLSGMYAQEEMERAAGADDAEKKVQKARDYVTGAIAKATGKELTELREMNEKSSKYDKSQKAELIDMVDKRIDEIMAEEKK